MENYKIANATAIYTGGGIYIYHGKVENGNYFRACDEWECIRTPLNIMTDCVSWKEHSICQVMDGCKVISILVK